MLKQTKNPLMSNTVAKIESWCCRWRPRRRMSQVRPRMIFYRRIWRVHHHRFHLFKAHKSDSSHGFLKQACGQHTHTRTHTQTFQSHSSQRDPGLITQIYSLLKVCSHFFLFSVFSPLHSCRCPVTQYTSQGPNCRRLQEIARAWGGDDESGGAGVD